MGQAFAWEVAAGGADYTKIPLFSLGTNTDTHTHGRTCAHTHTHAQAKLILPFPDISELLGFAGQEPFCKNTHKMLSQCLEKAETGGLHLRHPRLKTSFPFSRDERDLARPGTHTLGCVMDTFSLMALFPLGERPPSLSVFLSPSLCLSLKAILCSPHSTPGCGCEPGLVPEPDSNTQREIVPYTHHTALLPCSQLIFILSMCSYNTMVPVYLLLSIHNRRKLINVNVLCFVSFRFRKKKKS